MGQHPMQLFLGDGKALPVGAVYHQDDELGRGEKGRKPLRLGAATTSHGRQEKLQLSRFKVTAKSACLKLTRHKINGGKIRP